MTEDRSKFITAGLTIAGVFLLIDSFILSQIGRMDYDVLGLKSWAADNGNMASYWAFLATLCLLINIIQLSLKSNSRNSGLNILVIIAVLASIAQASMVAENNDLALQIAAAIAFFMSITMMIESHRAVGAKESLEEIGRMAPGKARKRVDGNDLMVDPWDLIPGDTLRIQPGEAIHADGEIIKGMTSIQEANITGESIPADKQTGNKVFAGTTNLSGLIDIKVDRAGQDTTLGKVRELIAQAENSRLPFVRFIDQYIKYYTPIILMISVLVWFATDNKIDRVAALLVAACPIALILATPSVMVAALSAAARLGVLVKNVSDLEKLAKVNAIIMDKTGTVTKGELGIQKMAACETISATELITLAASAEQRSNHPVATAITQLAETANVPLLEPSELHEEPGRGIRAQIEKQSILAGNLAWMEENDIQEADFPVIKDLDPEGITLLYVARDGKALGWVALEDQIRDDAAELISELKEQNMKHIALVSGDRKSVTARVAGLLSMKNFQGACLPSEKVDYVDAVKKKGFHTAFVGDGVNDGPALANSDIGIAMGAAGSNVAMDSADIALMNNQLNRLPFLIKLSRHVHQVILQNIIIGVLFVVGGIILSAAGILRPLPAAVIQLVSALIIILNSARLVREGEDIE
ncbi:MAG: cation-translocating P-type ATPase [Lentisphaeria bacterium]|nr:cation-translocating P-type ATPase [Lentisphaeria bacterium]NQZ66799.1 cation-translocating P-type ATPase [Lentisphaeria bacterium]